MLAKFHSLTTYYLLLTTFFTTFCFFSAVAAYPAFAQSPTATSSATTQNLKERIERIVDEKRDQIKGVLSEFGQQRRGIIGEVQRVSEETITIKTTKATEIIPITDQVTLVKNEKAASITDVAVGEWLVVMGIIEADEFQPRRILISATSLRPKPHFVMLGAITEVSRSGLNIEPRNKSVELESITLGSKTVYQDINGNELERTDLKKDMQALIIGTQESAGKSAEVVRVLTVIESDN